MDSRERALLRCVAIFGELDERALDDVLLGAHRRRVAKGDTVFQQDDEARAFFVLVEGRLKVTQTTADGQRVVVRFIGPGEIFGCVAVFGGARYPGTATAVADSRMIGWTRGATQLLMERHPQIAMQALGTVGGRLQETHARLREISTERVERRIAHALVRLAEQAGTRALGGIRIDFPISRQDVAEMTGTTLHSVSRVLCAWAAQGIVASGRQKITICDLQALIAIADELPASSPATVSPDRDAPP
jgi:CRP/FNR family transcriptional regulator, nitrogen oxide reductase regulator